MPSSIINSDDGVISGTSGLKSSGGDDGVLVFQSKGTETARINTDKQIVAAAGTASLPIYSTTGDLNTGIYFPAADNIGFATGGTIRGRWTTDGLCFGSDTAAANALDDYEQGTFTPTYIQGITTPTYQTQTGKYTKIGNLVMFSIRLTASGGTRNASALQIGGLPFTSFNGGPQSGAWYVYTDIVASTSTNLPTLYITENNTRIEFYNTVGNPFAGNDMNAVTNQNYITGQYFTE